MTNKTGNRVHVEVSGLTGSGKSAVMGEIEIALRAIGLTVEHDAEFQSEKNMTHADWQDALGMYQPTIVLRERNIPRAAISSEQQFDPKKGYWEPAVPEPFSYALFPWLWRRLTGWRDAYGRKADLFKPWEL